MGVVSFTLRLFYPWFPLNRGLGGSQIRFEVLGLMVIVVNMHNMKTYGGMKVQLYSFPTWALHGMNSQLQAHAISPQENSS